MSLLIRNRIILALVSVIIVFFVAGVGFILLMKREPADLKAKILDPKVQAYLVSWLKSHEAEITNLRDTGKLDYVTGGPGLGPVRLEFDWSVLGFERDLAQIRLIAEPGKDWVALFFRRSGNEGIALARTDDFGLPPKRIVAKSGQLAVYFDSRN